MLKRVFDIVCSLLGLLLCLPLFALLALLIKLESPGPVLFLQVRIGRNLKPFKMLKFRTMVRDAPGKGPAITVAGDGRITRLGRLLRRTKLDELPQLVNVLLGQMSLVGPRPEVRRYVSKYRQAFREVLRVRPGITDPASLAYADEEAVLAAQPDPEHYYVHVLLPEKLRLARQYVRRASLGYDLQLIALTLVRVLYPHRAVSWLLQRLSAHRLAVTLGVQVLLFALANYGAFLLRFDARPPAEQVALFLRFLPLLLLIRVGMLLAFGLHRGLWRYAGTRDLASIVLASSLGSALFALLMREVLGQMGYPRSIYVLDWMLNILLLGGGRMLRRLHERAAHWQGQPHRSRRVLLIGADQEAELFIRDVQERPWAHPYELLGVLGDDPAHTGLRIREVPILGTLKDLEAVVSREEPDELVLTQGLALSPSVKRRLRGLGLPLRGLPSLCSILRGRARLEDLQEPCGEDMLFRCPASGSLEPLRAFLKGRRVMVTGAGGSIGAELCRQIAGFEPQCLVMLERHEESLYRVQMQLSHQGPSQALLPVVADVTDQQRVQAALRCYRPQVLLHAAAYKHVPLMEHHPYEAFRTNVLGTSTMAQEAKEAGVEKFVLVSTDKAVNPSSIMGATKRVAELLLQALSSRPGPTRFITVRFGNVLESSGSVLPLFREQIRRGGPLTITHPEVSRYFMTISEAVNLLLHAAALGQGGEVFVLDMGEPVKILELARRLLGLYGLRPGLDIEIAFTGLRPGEKLHEELFYPYEQVLPSGHPRIRRAVSSRAVGQELLQRLQHFRLPSMLPPREAMKMLRELLQEPSLAVA